jgi:hypothetical protein
VKGVTRFVPSGLRIETFVEVIVTFEIFRLIRWFVAPVKVALEVEPALFTVTTTGEPPGTMVKLALEPTGLTTHDATAAIAATKAQRVDERRPTLV